MGSFLQIILIAIFFYLVYKIFIQKYLFKPYKKDTFKEETPEDPTIRKRIDMSDVEDADFKEIE
ncbi:MAG: hypothetical protein K0B52_05710 [FCB group bacterium]|nr:hypothetical protein [FCB group bacterium]